MIMTLPRIVHLLIAQVERFSEPENPRARRTVKRLKITYQRLGSSPRLNPEVYEKMSK
jgi:hypothetical protein